MGIGLPRVFGATVLAALAWAASATTIQNTSHPKAAKRHSAHWDPPDVDAPLPSLSSSAPCFVDQVLQGAGDRAKELVTNLQNFTARERILYEEVDEFGDPVSSQNGAFDYLVAINDTRPGSLDVSETRNGASEVKAFPGTLADTGLPAIALLFHPYYVDGYDMRCEGLAQWNGQPTWVIHFQQRRDKPANTHVFRTSDARFPAKLKGRAWIAADSFQILHIETNLMQAIPMINLRAEAISIDYAPVQFHTRNVTVWLPQAAEVFTDFTKQRYHVRHSFTNFLLFSVDTKQEIEKPHQP
jgi:hypothetical protein